MASALGSLSLSYSHRAVADSQVPAYELQLPWVNKQETKLPDPGCKLASQRAVPNQNRLRLLTKKLFTSKA